MEEAVRERVAEKAREGGGSKSDKILEGTMAWGGVGR